MSKQSEKAQTEVGIEAKGKRRPVKPASTLINFLTEEPMPYEQRRSLCSAPARRWNDFPEVEPIHKTIDLAQLERLRTFARTGEIVPATFPCVNCGHNDPHETLTATGLYVCGHTTDEDRHGIGTSELCGCDDYDPGSLKQLTAEEVDQIERLRTFARTGEIVPIPESEDEEPEMCVNCCEREATHDVTSRDDMVGYVERMALCEVCDPNLDYESPEEAGYVPNS